MNDSILEFTEEDFLKFRYFLNDYKTQPKNLVYRLTKPGLKQVFQLCYKRIDELYGNKYSQFPNVCQMINFLSENIYEDEYIPLSTKQYFLILLKSCVE